MKRNTRFRPEIEAAEPRFLLSVGGVLTGALGPNGFLYAHGGTAAVRPNTPVLPFGSPLATATFLDPYSHVLNGNHVVLGSKSYVGPYATLNATTGFIKIGSGSAVLDNATIVSNPNRIAHYPPSVIVGDNTSVSYGAMINGPSEIGGFSTSTAAAKPTGIGPNALIDGATVEAGAIVGALARVGPGVVIPSGMYVLPGANVTTQAQATDPALGQVEPIPASVLADLNNELARDSALAAGYTNLYQGNPATGTNLGVDSTVTPGISNGSLAAVSGTSPEPGPATSTAATGITFEPKAALPQFTGPFKPGVSANLPGFKARITGDARFTARAHSVQNHVGRSNSFRADQGQPLTFASAPSTGFGVTINSPLGGSTTTNGTTKTVGGVTIGQNLVAQDNAVLLGGPTTTFKIGDNVTLGGGSVVSRSNIGTGAVIGTRAYVSGSTVNAGQVVPPGTILIDNKVVGTVQW